MTNPAADSTPALQLRPTVHHSSISRKYQPVKTRYHHSTGPISANLQLSSERLNEFYLEKSPKNSSLELCMSAPLELACATVRKRPLKGDLYPLVGSSEPQALIDFEITPTGHSWLFGGLAADLPNFTAGLLPYFLDPYQKRGISHSKISSPPLRKFKRLKRKTQA